MYKEQLPADCPPSELPIQNVITLYRIFRVESCTNDNFICYAAINDKFIGQCLAYGLSFYDNIELAKSKQRKKPALGNYIAEIKVHPDHGKLLPTGNSNGHYTLWLYNDFKPETVDYKIVEIIKSN